MFDSISKRAAATVKFTNFKRIWAPRAKQNSYHPARNPKGIIDLGGADNKLCEDIVLDRLKADDVNQDQVDSSILYYATDHGADSFRKAVCHFLNERLSAKQTLSPDNLLVTSGVGAALDMLATVIGDPGDCVLSPSPYYTRIKTDVGERAQLRTVDVATAEPDPARPGQTRFVLTVDKLKHAYMEATQRGDHVKGIILINPHNPTGQIYSIQLIREILEFAAQHKLHVVVDEIYALGVFEGDEFRSVLTLESLPDPDRTHFVWGFSKDFCLSGFRVGVLHSWNELVISSIKPYCYFAAVPCKIQFTLQTLILDKAWLDEVFFPTCKTRMRKGRDLVASRLQKLGVPHETPTAAFFIWADFSKYLPSKTMTSQMKMFETLFYGGVYIEPANAYYSDTPGFFRIIFTVPDDIINKAFDRIEDILKPH